jgi:hypothetical protein
VARGSKFLNEANHQGDRSKTICTLYLDVLQQSFNLHCICVVCQGSSGLKALVLVLVLGLGLVSRGIVADEGVHVERLGCIRLAMMERG